MREIREIFAVQVLGTEFARGFKTRQMAGWQRMGWVHRDIVPSPRSLLVYTPLQYWYTLREVVGCPMIPAILAPTG